MPEMGISKVVTVLVMTTTQRDALAAVEGMIIFNSTTDQLEEYDGSTWQAVGQVIMDTHEADLDAHTLNPLEQIAVGGYYMGIIGYGSDSQIFAANTLYAFIFCVARAMTFDRMAIGVVTGASGKSIRLGVYAVGSNFYPTSLKRDFGAVAVDTVGEKAAVADLSLTKGYYALVAISDGTPTVSSMRLYDVPVAYAGMVCQASGYWDHNPVWSVAQAYGALPDPFTAGGALTNMDVMLTPLRVKSLD